VSESESIPLMEVVHELRVLRNTDLRSAISEMNDLLATGQLPQADALIDGVPTKIDAGWWWASTNFEYPNSSVMFNLVADGEPRPTRATEIRLDCAAWERQKARIQRAAQGNGLPPDRDDPNWDHPVKLPDAIRLWFPALAFCLDQVKWASPDHIRDIALRLKNYDHPTRVGARRDRAKRKREQDPNTKIAHEALLDSSDAASDPGLPEPLRDDWVRLLQEWDQWDDAERLVYAFELAAHLIIEKTKPDHPYILEFVPLASDDDLRANYRRVGEARHEGLGPYDFDIRNSSIRSPGGNWLPVRILGGIEVEAKRMLTARLAREARDRAATAAWKAEYAKPMRERQYFRYDEIGDALAKDSESPEIDSAKRDRIVGDLSDWTIRGEFDSSGDSEVVVLSGEPPFFLPLGPVPPGGILADPDGLILKRNACRRYLRNSSLERAPRLLRNWFPEAVSEMQSPEGKKNLPNNGESEPASPVALVTSASAKEDDRSSRGAYRGALDLWMAQKKLPVLRRMGAAAIAREFKAYCDQALPGLVPLLPKRLRSMHGVIDRIIKRRVEVARAQNQL
jgi:hypothetical protein